MQKHKTVTLVVQRGNHDETAYLAVLFALAERYRNEPRITVQRKPGEFFVMEWGKVLLASCHGDKAKAEVLVDVELLQVNSNKESDIGASLANYSFTLGRLGFGASQPEAGKPRLSLN